MSQEIILKKFTAYLTLIADESKKQFDRKKTEMLAQGKSLVDLQKMEDEFQQRIKNLQQDLKAGHCFGLALCHGAMDVVGALDWWENALVAICNWDGTPEALDDPKFAVPASRKGEKAKNLREIFKIGINFVVPQHTSNESDVEEFIPTEITQLNMLHPDAHILPSYKKNQAAQTRSYFEVLDSEDKLQTIKQRKAVAGNFTVKELESLLDEETFRNKICLVHSDDHTVRIKYNGEGVWMLYDPNFSHRTLFKMQCKGSKEQIIHQLHDCLQETAIAIEVGSLNENDKINFTAYDDILKNSPASLLRSRGLNLIARHTPANLSQLFELAKSNNELRSAIAKLLIEKTADSYTALYTIARHAPATLPTLFELAKDNNELRSAIAKSLIEKTTDSWTALHRIARYAPATLPMLFELAKDNNELRSAIAKSLIEKTADSWTGLHIIARNAPECLPQLVELAKQNNELKAAIARSLVQKNDDNSSGLQMVLGYAPNNLYALLDCVLTDCNNLDDVLQSLAVSIPSGETGWHQIDKFIPTEKERIKSLLLTKIKELDTERLLNLGDQLTKALFLEDSPYHGLCKERHEGWFFRKEYGKTGLWQSLMKEVKAELTLKAKNQDTQDQRYQAIQKMEVSR